MRFETVLSKMKRDLLVHVAKATLLLGQLCSHVKQTAPGFEPGIEPLLDRLFQAISPLVMFQIRARLLCSHMSKGSLVSEQRL